MGALLGVSRGSQEPPKFIILEYNGTKKKDERPVVLVGKTITFDTGGISLKPAENMEHMKADMTGGAEVLASIRAAARLKLPLRLISILPVAENMPGGRAMKPGDIVTTLSGKTVEVQNTDAEGRLILADGLAYAMRYKPAALIDIATLTGACVVALGQFAIGMFGTDQALKEQVRKSGQKAGERVWEMPLWEEYFEQLKSDVADMRNIGGRGGGMITAALFLRKFVGDCPWGISILPARIGASGNGLTFQRVPPRLEPGYWCSISLTGVYKQVKAEVEAQDEKTHSLLSLDLNLSLERIL
jgi:leucyl aminopeptidase